MGRGVRLAGTSNVNSYIDVSQCEPTNCNRRANLVTIASQCCTIASQWLTIASQRFTIDFCLNNRLICFSKRMAHRWEVQRPFLELDRGEGRNGDGTSTIQFESLLYWLTFIVIVRGGAGGRKWSIHLGWGGNSLSNRVCLLFDPKSIVNRWLAIVKRWLTIVRHWLAIVTGLARLLSSVGSRWLTVGGSVTISIRSTRT